MTARGLLPAVVIVLVSCSAAQAAQITEIAPTSTVQSASPIAISDATVVAGTDSGGRSGTNTGPFRWIAGNYDTLTPAGNALSSDALDINSSAEVAGNSPVASTARAVVWKAGSDAATVLPCLDPGCPGNFASAGALALNDSGTVVGYEVVPGGSFAACGGVSSCEIPVIWRNGTPTELGSSGGSALDVSSTNIVLVNDGTYANSSSVYHLDNNGQITPVTCLSRAYKMNDANVVVGSVLSGSSSVPGYWEAGTCTPLPLPTGDTTGVANAVNVNGVIVGTTSQAGTSRAVSWEKSTGAVTDLNTLLPAGSGWVLQQALDVNALGQILGTGTLNGQRRSFILEPASLTGKVTDARSQPISGVVITATGKAANGNPVTARGTTGANGNYGIDLPPGTYDLSTPGTVPAGQPQGGRWTTESCPADSPAPGTCHVVITAGTGQEASFHYWVDDLEVLGIEPTQGSQFLRYLGPATVLTVPGLGGIPGAPYNGVPLVRGLPTVVRLYADLAFGTPDNADGTPRKVTAVPALLHAYANGHELAGSPLSPDPGYQTSLLASSGTEEYLVQREDPNLGYTFTLPAAWSENASLTLAGELNPQQGGQRPFTECNGCDDNDAFGISGVVFKQVPPLTVNQFQVRYSVPATLHHPAPLQGPDVSDEFSKIRELFPIVPSDLRVQPFSAQIDLTRTVATVVRRFGIRRPDLADCISRPLCRNELEAGETLIVQRHLRPPTGKRSLLLGSTPFADGVTYAHPKVSFSGPAHPARPLTSLAHELMHQLGFPHASPGCGGGANGQYGEPWPPDQQGLIQGVGTVRQPGSGGPGRYASVPSTRYDLMSYCTGGSDADAWLSALNWTRFVNLGQPAAHAATARAAAAPGTNRAGGPGTRLAVGAVVSPGGAVDIVDVEGTTDAASRSASSPFRFVAVDAHGHPKASVGVAPAQMQDSSAQLLSAVLPSAGVSEIKVMSGARTVSTMRRPSRRPTVQLLGLTRNHKLKRGHLILRWRARGARGAMLTATVELTTNGGRVWRTLITGLAARQFAVPRAALVGVKRLRLRVTINDGFSDVSVSSSRLRVG
jgi:hypothetical protein